MVGARPAIRGLKLGRSASLRLCGTNAGGLHGVCRQAGGASPYSLFSTASTRGRPHNPSPFTRPAPDQQPERFRLIGKTDRRGPRSARSAEPHLCVGYCGSGPDNLLYLVSLDRMGRTELSRLAGLRAWSPVREVGEERPQCPVVPRLPGLEESRAAPDELFVWDCGMLEIHMVLPPPLEPPVISGIALPHISGVLEHLNDIARVFVFSLSFPSLGIDPVSDGEEHAPRFRGDHVVVVVGDHPAHDSGRLRKPVHPSSRGSIS